MQGAHHGVVAGLAVALGVEKMPEEEVQRGGLAVSIADYEGPCRPLTLSGFENRSKGGFGQRAVRLQRSSPEIGQRPIENWEKVSIGTEIKTARPEPPELPLPDRPAPPRLVLIRHGQSTWNREHRIQGQLDPPLSEDGRRQAELLAARLARRTFAAHFASDLKRAFETAEIIGAAVGMRPVPEAALREIYLGEWEGLRTDEIAARYPEAWARWVEEPDWNIVPGGEREAEFDARVGQAIDQILAQHSRGDVLVVTHGGVIQVALHRVVGKPSRGLFPFRIQNASMTVLERSGGRMVISGVNDVAHLEMSLVTERQGLGDD
ncbi:MAG: histidine phosphatase family protein [Chloroflexi bacterium]|nr:MAG: histidine phosphatase family protein [Chloroflexota bacterium]